MLVEHSAEWDAGPRYVLKDRPEKLVDPLLARSFIRQGWLIAGRDGLFADTSQTYVVRADLDLSPPAKRERKKVAA
jgi:hypothetical protein